MRYPLYYSGSPNLGDAINPILYKRMTGKECVLTHKEAHAKIIACGSIVQEARPFDFIWGAGSMYPDIPLKCDVTTHVLACRGPLTSELLYKYTKNACNVYGDPALLISRYIKPSSKKREFGIIPHYTDRDYVRNDPKLSPYFIDIMGDVKETIAKITECEFIISSALHGIVCAESYNIPTLWVEFSDNVSGNGFKFHDYYAGTGRPPRSPLNWRDKRNIDEARYLVQEWWPPKTNLNLLSSVCPFYFCKTDYMRWRESDGDWLERNKTVASMIDQGSRIIEFGAGRQLLRRLIDSSCSYTPSDIYQRTLDTIVCDLNIKPTIDLWRYDTIVMSGVLEYVETQNIVKFLKYIKRFDIKTFICSYTHGGHPEMRKSNGWVNDINRETLLDIFCKAGFFLLRDFGGIYKFTR